ncbi:MAG: M20 metallopeptidase family protein [Trueperaceae bacterium]
MNSSNILAQSKKMHEKIRTWRRTIHRYPELSFTETKTSQLVQDNLKQLGIKFQKNIAKTGVVAEIRGGKGPTVGLRADMDALPIQEENGTDFDSTRPGIMHACGHDAHTSMLLGAATLLKDMADRGELGGGVRLLFQPSEEHWDEEGKSGGRRMVEEGALKNLDAVFALHVHTKMTVGEAGTRVGPLLAAVDDFILVIEGKGGHAAAPHTTTDVIASAGLVINAIHQIVSRRVDPIESGVITIGTINGGSATNVIGTKVKLTGTIRSMKPHIRKRLHQELKNAANVVKSLGCTSQLTIRQGYPSTVNSPEATEVSLASLEKILGKKNVKETPMVMGAEDFSYMAQEAPGCFMFLGVKNKKWQQEYPVHTPTFRMDEDALPIGTAMLCGSALEWLHHSVL